LPVMDECAIIEFDDATRALLARVVKGL